MKPIDIILLIPLAFGLYDGYKKGFLLVSISVIALIVGIAGAFKLLQIGIDFLIIYFPHMPKLLPFLSFILIFLGISIGIYLLGMLIKEGLRFTIFSGSLDNFMGAIVGLFQWVFMLSIVVWLINQSALALPKSLIKDSIVLHYLETLAPLVIENLKFMMPFAENLFTSIKHIFREL